MFCPNCSITVPDNAVVCPSCRAFLREQTPPGGSNQNQFYQSSNSYDQGSPSALYKLAQNLGIGSTELLAPLLYFAYNLFFGIFSVFTIFTLFNYGFFAGIANIVSIAAVFGKYGLGGILFLRKDANFFTIYQLGNLLSIASAAIGLFSYNYNGWTALPNSMLRFLVGIIYFSQSAAVRAHMGDDRYITSSLLGPFFKGFL